MPGNPKKRGTNASQSFRLDEIRFLESALALLSRHPDAAQLIQSDPARRVARKVHVMRRSIERQVRAQ